ncbi:hypothetical protein IscW_ISCW023426 [Ixodes scapularis]|uniref:Uncharacterized protein n=1 Tax=Ixodes scapularis TaxID=6945 RepID=B7QJM1_IXOSC|nr:hypothetical protein IscW_ISCW023426 [Ixodes scapularis]|eukprot:XP_002415378.1 hypothetical protein IscW_ISCW023426 [Ixodes scapularis]
MFCPSLAPTKYDRSTSTTAIAVPVDTDGFTRQSSLSLSLSLGSHILNLATVHKVFVRHLLCGDDVVLCRNELDKVNAGRDQLDLCQALPHLLQRCADLVDSRYFGVGNHFFACSRSLQNPRPGKGATLEARQGVAYSINLCDTTNDPDVHISDILVEEGHALPADTLPTQVEVGSQAAAQAVDQQGRRLASQQASGSAGPQAGQQVVHPISQSVARHAGQQANPRTGLEAGAQLAQPTGLPVPERIVRPAFESAGQQNGQPSSSRSAPEPAGAPEENEDFMSVLRRELDGPCNARSIKPEYLKSGKCLMVLNYDQTPYVSSANVGQLLGLTSDQLLQNLEEKQIQFRILVLHRDSNVELFNQMAGVNDLLNLFEFPGQRLRHEVSSVLRSFDPNADYWMNVSDDSDSDDSPSVEDELRKLSARRKEIHADIMTNKVSNLKVDELSSIETEIARCEALLSEKVKRTIPEGPQVAAFTNGYAAPLEDW